LVAVNKSDQFPSLSSGFAEFATGLRDARRAHDTGLTRAFVQLLADAREIEAVNLFGQRVHQKLAVTGALAQRGALVALSAVSVVYRAGTVGLSGADFRLLAGELVLVSGPSGAGKSTFLAVMSGRLRATSGSVLLNGAEAASMGATERAAWRRSSAFVAQDAPMLERRTVAENVTYALEISRPNVHADARALEVLERLGIGETGDRRPSELSGGQRQRAALAQALAKSPAALFVDEPTANLDPRTASEVVAVIASHCQAGMACVVVGHHDAPFATSASRRLWVNEGRVRAVPYRPYETLTESDV
jgi:ABC-type lipoprotein export system ATPase subunit